jgi:hypothetical protein
MIRGRTSLTRAVDGRLLLTGYQYDYVFDWTIMKYQQTQQVGGSRPHSGLVVLFTLTYIGTGLWLLPGFSHTGF